MPISRLDILNGIELYQQMESIRKGALPPSSSDMPADQDTISFGIIVCVSVPVLLLTLYMAVFGRRMRWTAVRWHMINCTVWGLLHLAHISSFAEKAPFANWITDREWSDKRIQVECLTRSIFPTGMFFIYIEQMLLVCSPRFEYNRVFNFFFAFCLICVVNGLVIFCFGAMYMDTVWWYNPIELFNLISYTIFFMMTFFYFIFCIFGTFCCCFVFFRKSKGSQKPVTFLDMWLLFPYAVIPSIMYYPSYIVTFISFSVKVLMKWAMENHLMEQFMGGQSQTSSGSSPMMDKMMNLMKTAMNSLPYFVMLFPLIHCLLAIVCLAPFREQFFFLISCGRLYSGKKIYEKPIKKDWKIAGMAPIPVYPTKSKEIYGEGIVKLDQPVTLA